MKNTLHKFTIVACLLMLPGCNSGCNNDDSNNEIRDTYFTFTNNCTTSARINAVLGTLGAFDNDALQPGASDSITTSSTVEVNSSRVAGNLSGTVVVSTASVRLPEMNLIMEETYTIEISQDAIRVTVTVTDSTGVSLSASAPYTSS